ncbi:MAG: RNA pseudouridine synthase [Planctomycetaceae bacterium]|nr:RNA pseudouridine synthase [Planctomycetaceae bacterium]
MKYDIYLGMEIIYQDNDILAIDKPAGVSVTHDRGGNDSIIELIQRKPGFEDTLVVHRLDKDTSGIMVLARNADSHRRYCQLFEESQVRKIYLALVTGIPDGTTGEIDAPLMQDKKDVLKMSVDMKKGKESQTRWQLLADFGRVSLVAARPLTGRTHQIRVHFQYAGFPLAIDPLYSGNEPIMLSSFKSKYKLGKFAEEKPLIERLTLCAYELEIENHHFIAPVEKKLKATIKMLKKYSSKKNSSFLNEEHFEQILASKPLTLDI